MVTDQPTDEQLQALLTFADANGRSWKSKLRHAWETGLYDNYPGTGRLDLLQQIRNTLGPSWLVRFSLTRAKSEWAVLTLHALVEKNHTDAMIAHRFIEAIVGEQAHGRDFAVKVPMAEAVIAASTGRLLSRSLAAVLKAYFPWLGTDEEVSGADTVDGLNNLYAMALNGTAVPEDMPGVTETTRTQQ